MMTIKQTEIVETAIDLIATHPERHGSMALHRACKALGMKLKTSTKAIAVIVELEPTNYRPWTASVGGAEQRIESLRHVLATYGYRAGK